QYTMCAPRRSYDIEQTPQGHVGGGEEAPGGQAQGRERGEEEVFVRPQQGEEEVRRRDEEGEDSGPEGLGQVFLRLRQAIGEVDQGFGDLIGGSRLQGRQIGRAHV